MSPWSQGSHHVELPEVHHGSSPPAASCHPEGRHCYGNATTTVCLCSTNYLLRCINHPFHSQAVDITSCGNFAAIGSSAGRVDVYNLQSGLHRGCYGDNEKGEQTRASLSLAHFVFHVVTNLRPSFPAHSGVVRGVAVDALNQLTFTAGSDGLLKFWRFKTKKQEEQLKLNAAPASMILHRER